MSVPFASIFNGDVNVLQGSDVTQFGWGDIYGNRKLILKGTEDSTGVVSQGTLLVDGGARIGQNLNAMKNLYVLYGASYLTETHVDTTTSAMTVTGGNALSISVGAASQFISTSGNLSLISQTQSLQLYGGLNSNNAVDIEATNQAGGVSVLSGSLSGISLSAGSGGLYGSSSNGNIILTANNGNGSFTVNSQTSNQNLVLNVTGTTDSQLRVESSGSNVTNTAIVVNTTNTAGNIQISNANGLGTGRTSVLTGSGGYSLVTNTSGPISLVSQAGTGQFIVQTSGANQNLLLGITGSSDSSVLLKSSGINVTNPALQIQTTSSSGNIEISQASQSVGHVNVYTGIGGFNATTQTGGSINMTTNGAVSNYTNATINDNQDLTVSVTGNTNSRVVLSSTGTSNQAIKLQTTNGSGGINLTSVGVVQLESTNPVLGVQIATATSGIPVKIGTTNSTTTIMGNLDVKGVTSSIESTVVTITDNIIVVNNAPSGTADGGLAIKRYQPANNTGYGDVVQDIPEETGTIQASGNTSTTLKLDVTANATDNYYNGWWIKITGGTGLNQVRRIKSYIGATKVATVYSTAEQTGLLNNPSPVEGMDFLTVPDSSSTYALYPCHYVMEIWDETKDEFAFICSNTDPAQTPNIAHYSNLHINNLVSNTVYAQSINDTAADITFDVTLNDSNQIPVMFPSTANNSYNAFPSNFGIYLVFVKPKYTTTRAHAIFMIGRIDNTNLPGSVVRFISVKGMSLEQLNMQWRANQYPELLYSPSPLGGTSSTVYKVKVVTL